ncbi:MAG TPA: NADH-quinone oxidoreductase subunit J [Acidimicrobiales bacterium]|nr:NADH-quinone oxidoreductase subunit J [Acidimicrobiales bacterium]
MTPLTGFAGHGAGMLGVASTVDALTFAVAAFIVLAGGIGVVVSRNPVHAALMLVMTLFGVAVLFVEQQANFLAAVQVIVYAGAIVVLFLFVIMFLGVDRQENLAQEPLRIQRPLAIGLVVLALAGLLVLGIGAHWSVGAHSVAGAARGQSGGDVAALGRSVFTTYLFAFEATSALLVIAVVGAVFLARRPRGQAERDDPQPAPPAPPGEQTRDGQVARDVGSPEANTPPSGGAEPVETEPGETEPVQAEEVVG